MARIENWNKTRPVIKIGKQSQTITIPAFSDGCGLVKNVLVAIEDEDYGAGFFSGSDWTNFVDNLTFEAWVYPTGQIPGGLATGNAIFSRHDTGSGFPQILFVVDKLTGQFSGYLAIGGGQDQVQSTKRLEFFKWNHVVLTYTSNVAKIYINGVLDVNFIDDVAGEAPGSVLDTISGTAENSVAYRYNGKIGTISIWRRVLTAEEIRNRYNTRRSITGIDTNLKAYFDFRGSTIKNLITTNLYTIVVPAKVSFEVDDTLPLIYGASFAPIVFNVVATKAHSLKFPVIVEDNANFGLVLAWTDTNGNYQRRTLSRPAAGNIDINPTPADYNGEELPLNYNIEVWNKDGESTVDMSSALILEVSTLTNPTTSVDYTKTALVTPTQKTSIFEPFPLAGFPLLFDQPATDF